jgi:hypothetical protein
VHNTEQAKTSESYAEKEKSQSKSMDVELAHSVASTAQPPTIPLPTRYALSTTGDRVIP